MQISTWNIGGRRWERKFVENGKESKQRGEHSLRAVWQHLPNNRKKPPHLIVQNRSDGISRHRCLGRYKLPTENCTPHTHLSTAVCEHLRGHKEPTTEIVRRQFCHLSWCLFFNERNTFHTVKNRWLFISIKIQSNECESNPQRNCVYYKHTPTVSGCARNRCWGSYSLFLHMSTHTHTHTVM